MRRLIGFSEVAAAGGLLGGLGITPLSVAAALGLVALMVGAVGFHLRAGDPAKEYAPAVALCGLAAVLAILQLA